MEELADCRKIGQRIRMIRRERNLTDLDVSLELGYDTSNYSKIENGHVWPDCRTLTTLCKLFQCQPETIIYGEDSSAPSENEAYLSSLPESEKRRLFRMLYLVFHCETLPLSSAFHHLFGTCVLDKSLTGEEKHMALLLEYERSVRRLPKRHMAKFLDIPKNRYYDLIHRGECQDIKTLVQLHRKLGYPMSFLLWNEITPSYFFSALKNLPDALNQNHELFVKAEEYGEFIQEFQSSSSRLRSVDNNFK